MEASKGYQQPCFYSAARWRGDSDGSCVCVGKASCSAACWQWRRWQAWLAIRTWHHSPVEDQADTIKHRGRRLGLAGDRDPEQVMLVAILDEDADDIAGREVRGVAEVDLAVDLGRVGLAAA